MSLVLETVDGTRQVLASIEVSGEEGPDQFEELTARLRSAAQKTVIQVNLAVAEISHKKDSPTVSAATRVALFDRVTPAAPVDRAVDPVVNDFAEEHDKRSAP